jgi:hypothetical protein
MSMFNWKKKEQEKKPVATAMIAINIICCKDGDTELTIKSVGLVNGNDVLHAVGAVENAKANLLKKYERISLYMEK